MIEMKKYLTTIFLTLIAFCINAQKENDSVLFPWEENGIKGVIDTLGNFTEIQGKINYPTISEKDKIKSDLIPFEYYGYFGFKNKAGQEIIPAGYEAVGNFNEGYTWVKIDFERYLFINEKEQPLIQYSFDKCFDFLSGMAKVYDINPNKGYNGFGFINTKGEIIIPIIYKNAMDFVQGFCLVEDEAGWCLINKLGEKIKGPVQIEKFWE